MVRISSFHESPLKHALLTLFVAALFPLSAWAAPVVSSTISPTSGFSNDIFLFSVVVSDASNEIQGPELHGGQDFQASFLGPRVSVVINNGVINQSKEFTYQLKPLKEGTLETPSATVSVGGKEFTTPPVSVRISKAPADKEIASGYKVSIVQRVSDRTPYRGQQVLLTTEIQSGERIFNPQLPDATVDGVWHEDLGKPDQSQRYINSQPYDIYTLRKAIYPLRSGEITIPARELSVQVRDRRANTQRGSALFRGFDPFSDSIFDDFFGAGALSQLNIKSNTLTLAVKPLPPPPPGVDPESVLVGRTALELTYSPHAINVGESKQLQIAVTSLGNLRPLRSLPIKLPPEIRIYEERPEQTFTVKDDLAVNRKVFNSSLVALSGGDFVIPPIELAYFDPESGSYQVATSESLPFKVNGPHVEIPAIPQQGAPQGNTSQPTPRTAPDVSAVGEEPQSATTPKQALAYTEPTLLDEFNDQVGTQGLILIIALLIIVVAAIYFVRSLLAKQSERELRIAVIDNAMTLAELKSALFVELIKHYALEATSGETVDGLRMKIARKENSISIRTELDTILDKIEQWSYSGTDLPPGQLEELRRRIIAVLF